MSMCFQCGGLIMEPNTAYGYVGKVCHCVPVPHSSNHEIWRELQELKRRLIDLEESERNKNGFL